MNERREVYEKCVMSLNYIAQTKGKTQAYEYLRMMVDKLALSDQEFQFCMEIIKMANGGDSEKEKQG
jgi:hypothetical protein